MDPPTTLPTQQRQGSADKSLLVLEAPRSAAPARDVVRAFFRAAVDESLPDLTATLADDAKIFAGGRGGRSGARDFWRRRLDVLDYSALGGQLVYRESDVETYRAEDLAALDRARSLRIRPRGDQVLVRVRVVETRVGRSRLFGDEVVFLLKPTTEGYKIEQMQEEFRLP